MWSPRQSWERTPANPFGAASDTLGWRRLRRDAGHWFLSAEFGYRLSRRCTGRCGLAGKHGRGSAGSHRRPVRRGDWSCNPVALPVPQRTEQSAGSGSTFGEFDYTSGSGWMYSLAVLLPGQSMSAVYLKDGDVLTLRYTRLWLGHWRRQRQLRQYCGLLRYGNQW